MSKVDCDTYEEMWDEMKVMFFKFDQRVDLHWREEGGLRHVRGDVGRDEEHVVHDSHRRDLMG